MAKKSEHLDVLHDEASGVKISYDWKRAASDLFTVEDKAVYFSRDAYLYLLISWLLHIAVIPVLLISGGVVLAITTFAVLWIEPTIALLVWLKIPQIRGLPKILVLFGFLGIDAIYLATWGALYYWDNSVRRALWWIVTGFLTIHLGLGWQLFICTVNIQHAILVVHLIRTHIKALNVRLANVPDLTAAAADFNEPPSPAAREPAQQVPAMTSNLDLTPPDKPQLPVHLAAHLRPL